MLVLAFTMYKSPFDGTSASWGEPVLAAMQLGTVRCAIEAFTAAAALLLRPSPRPLHFVLRPSDVDF